MSKHSLRLLKGSNSSDNVVELKTALKDPTAPTTSKNAPTTSKNAPTAFPAPTPVTPIIIEPESTEPQKLPCWKRCCTYMYDREKKLFCGRSCMSWLYMIIYSIMYLIFLATFTMILLYATLTIIKMTESYNVMDKSALMAYSDSGLGLTATPTALDGMPLISYTNGLSDEYNKYIRALDELLIKRRKRQVRNIVDLGPCGTAPYGYGAMPCVIIRPNKQLRWSAKPFKTNLTKDLPEELQHWLKMNEQKLWLHCSGYHSYDKEHIGRIQYYPYPPGFDPSVFPLDMQSDAPLIAIQISNFTLGLSLTVECRLWYDSGVSSVVFLLYVEPKSRSVSYKNV